MPQVNFYINKKEYALLKEKCKGLKCSPYKFAKKTLLEALKDVGREGKGTEDGASDVAGRTQKHEIDVRELENWFKRNTD